jgi:hypothetical protein
MRHVRAPPIHFINNASFPLSFPMTEPVNGAGTGINYGKAVYAVAAREGYVLFKEGWIPTAEGFILSPLQMLQKLNSTVEDVKRLGLPFLAAFWQTGNFSVAWAVFVKLK